MNPTVIFTGYLKWHYGSALQAYIIVWKNFLWFTGHVFSFTTLLKTLVSPWKRLDEDYQEGFHPSKFFETIVVNILMRIIGFLIRIVVITVGALIFLLIFFLGLFFFAFWIIAPVGIPVLIITGLTLLGF